MYSSHFQNLRYFLLIFLCILSVYCTGQKTSEQIFKEELGPSKYQGFEALIEAYDKFLVSNFPYASNHSERTTQFLNAIINRDHRIVFDSVAAVSLIEKLEKCGLRQDIFLFLNEQNPKEYNIKAILPQQETEKLDIGPLDENFEEIPTFNISKKQEKGIKAEQEKRYKVIDEHRKRRPYTNQNGLFLYALAKSFQQNQDILGYCEIKSSGLDISPSVMASAMLDNLPEEDHEIWYNKIPPAVDFYLFVILRDYGRK